MKIDLDSVNNMRNAVQARLFASFSEGGVCEGRLSDSALAAALASLALERAGKTVPAKRGREWLAKNQNADGGWGDTPDSPSNLATTFLSLCALHTDGDFTEVVNRARRWLSARTGGLEPRQIARAVADFYGSDRTFSGPILSIGATSGLLGPEPEAWRLVMQLPFEAACLPHGFYKWLNLPVVSYALPALIAIGMAKHRKCPTSFLPWRWLRDACAAPALRVLRRKQPASGGFLEAMPLTAFVALNLMAAGENDCPVLSPCIAFLEQEQRADGAWPIDTNLATWTTSQAVCALAGSDSELKTDSWHAMSAWRAGVRAYLLSVQQRHPHPFTNAAAGGWGWTHLSGAVPDADDTSAALLALKATGTLDTDVCDAARAGIEWLLGLQNRDGGIPTFCRGWMNLPFDRSCPDITAHALAAFAAWAPELPELAPRLERAIQRGIDHLARVQTPDGAWVPLWFGNQAAPRHENPVFGTACVVERCSCLSGRERVVPLIASGSAWLVCAQNPDGGWGGAPGVPSSIEETALALSALAPLAEESVVANGVRFLAERTKGGTCFPATPIGLYFASLWYSEELYPVIFAARALRVVSERFGRPHTHPSAER